MQQHTNTHRRLARGTRPFHWLLALISTLCLSCHTGTHPSALLITIDTLRPDRLSCYGYTAQKTPGIDTLAAQGVLFEDSVCDVPWTTSSMASVMTGTYATQHGLRRNTQRLPATANTLAEMLKQYGYQTAAIIGSFPLASLYGLNQGFDVYDEDLTQPILLESGKPPQTPPKVPAPVDRNDPAVMAKWSDDKVRNDGYRPDAEVTDHAIAWLRAHQGVPFLLWVHYFGPHERLVDDYVASHQEPRIIAEYDKDLQTTDAAVDRLLAAVRDLGLEKQLLVVLHADHGQSLGQHGYVGHGKGLSDSSLRVPLLVRFPGHIHPGTRVSQTVRNVDILPTITDELGLPVPSDLDGRSLVAAIQGQLLRPVAAYAETYVTQSTLWPIALPDGPMVLGPMTRHAIRTARWKLVENRLSAPCVKGTVPYRSTQLEDLDVWHLQDESPIPPADCDHLRVRELYDLVADPGELSNVAATHAAVTEQLAAMLDTMMTRKPNRQKVTLSPRDQERLRRLGYDPHDE